MRVSNECGWESFHTSNAGVGDDVMGGKPTVSSQHCSCSIQQKRPVAAPTFSIELALQLLLQPDFELPTREVMAFPRA